MAAFQMKRAAERILGNLPARGSDAAKQLGSTYPAEVRRLQWVIDETGLIYDEVRVEQAKMGAENIYLEMGATPEDQGGFRNLTSGASNAGGFKFREYRKPEDPLLHGHWDMYKRRLQTATQLGLSQADLAAIVTFTVSDYEYINPATAHNEAWLKKNYPDIVDWTMSPSPASLEQWSEVQDRLATKGQTLEEAQSARSGNLASQHREGQLHAGMLVKALKKLTPWRGTLYRGEGLSQKDFADQFDQQGGDVRHRSGVYIRTSVTSMSTDIKTAFAFAGSACRIIYELSVFNGRDIKEVSAVGSENEITILPGSRFAIQSVETKQDANGKTYYYVKGTQTQ
jgi:hypothetical protein